MNIESVINELESLLTTPPSKDEVHCVSRKVSQCLRLRLQGDTAAYGLFVADKRLLSAAA